MIKEIMSYLSEYDPEVGECIQSEYARQKRNIELIASENIVSAPVMLAMGTVLTNKYAEGYPGNRYYGGCECVDVVETIAIERAKQLFGAKYANVQPHSGAQANYAVYHALVKPGDTVLGMNLDNGGHLTHGSKANYSGKYYNIVSYGVDGVTGRIDYDNIRKIALECKPKMIIAGASAYPRLINFEKFSEIAKEVGAYLFVDMAHIAGLVAGKQHPNPMPFADIVTTTTHKTLRGPRGGLILTNDEKIAAKIDKAVFPGSQGGPLMHVIASKAIAFGEALRPEYEEYQLQIVRNAKALAARLMENGAKLVSDGTDNHLMLLDLRPFGLNGKEMEVRLDSVYITANKNAIPGDTENKTVTSGIRLGTSAVTARGFKEQDMKLVADLICLAATDYENSADKIRAAVNELCDKHQIYE
jgi:glycine hydroxymethyltransferase